MSEALPSDATSRPPVPPWLVIAVAIVGVSWAAILVRWSDASAYVLAFWRLALSLVIIGAALLVVRRDKRHARLTTAEVGALALAGGFLAFHFVTFFMSVKLTTVASATLLVNLHPLFAAVMSAVWLREPPTAREWAGIAVAVVGVALIGGAGLALGPTALQGDVLALAGAALFSGYFIIGRWMRQRLGIWVYAGWVYAFAAVFLLPFVLWRGDPLLDYSAREWWIFAGLAAGPMLLGHTGFNWALRYVRAYIVNLAVLGEPLGASLLAWWLLGDGEVPGLSTVVGGGLIIAGLGISIYAREEGRE
ncbi:MAG: DMT family transporter [Gemmatimonadetes bacterium]|uniref:DMT family transporter n=1 Tax=Candidatus Kutchimonas denitrificans TaxID=3056748 RepID=A0AAE4Z9G5_9BACT|nr:DMT family transporter [Gemmatimonadota bacterium]NIR73946.1 DMT family transporter [Candidatus Kutchimonas denitrificans]NIR99752.1 DMT family transporter [Gemmatimonadota bacterium]NIT65337.1 DMT family transporter [Gemmatimonadota bacterium]NIW73786.1 EamA family transporter [Gemmatimonadota bacterium]